MLAGRKTGAFGRKALAAFQGLLWCLTKEAQYVGRRAAGFFCNPLRMTVMQGPQTAGADRNGEFSAQECAYRPEVLRAIGGYIDGDIRISGHPKDQKTFARISGYVEQTDSHAPQVPMLSLLGRAAYGCVCASQQRERCVQTTVHEALQFSALLRLGEDVSADQREVRPCVDRTPMTCTLWPFDLAQAQPLVTLPRELQLLSGHAPPAGRPQSRMPCMCSPCAASLRDCCKPI